MLTNDYFTEINPYAKHAEHEKYYCFNQLEETCSKISRTRGTSLGDSNKLDYKLIAFLGGMFCVYFYVLSLLAQQCFTFFVTTFLLTNATALQCQHYAYHLLHFLLAHLFTFASKLLFNKISQVTDRIFTKVCSAAKYKYLRLSSLNFGYLYNLLRKCKMRQLLPRKGVKSEDRIALICNCANKNRRKRKLQRILKKNFFENLQQIKRSRNLYHKLSYDEHAIYSKNVFNNNMKAVNKRNKGDLKILKVTELNYVEVSRTPINGNQPHIASPGSSQDQGSTDYISYNAGAYGKENNNSNPPFNQFFSSGFNKRIQPIKNNVEAIKKSITANLKNKRVFLNQMKNRDGNFHNIVIAKCSRKERHRVSVLNKEKRKFKWKKRHKDFIVMKMKSPKNRQNEMKLATRVTSSRYSYQDVDELDADSKWYKTQYEKSIGKATEQGITYKNVLRRLKCQAKIFKILSPVGFGYRDQVKMKQKAVVLDWGKSPTAKLCTCPLTACTCEGNSLGPATDIPRGRLFSKYLPGVVAIRVMHDISCGYADYVLRRCAPAPARTLSPLLDDAVSAKRLHYMQTGAANMPAEFCASGCKHFYLKTNKVDFDNLAGVVPSLGHQSKTENTTGSSNITNPSNTTNTADSIDTENSSVTEKPMSEDGLVEEEIEGAGETPVYSKNDNIYARGFTLTIATQTEFDENGRLLLEETDRIKVPFTLRYTTTRDLRGLPMNIQHFDPCALPHPTYELTFETLLHVRPELKEKVKKGIEVTLKTLSGTVSSYKRSWILGVEEMSERLSSYARGLQSRVRLGPGEDKVDMCDKDMCTYQRSEDRLAKPNNKCCDGFEEAKHFAQPAKGLSWPDIRKMRYDESIPTENICTPAKSETEVSNKFQHYLDSLKMERCNEALKEKSCMNTKVRPCGVKFHSDCSLTRSRNTLDFSKTESIEKSDPQLSKKMVKCLCHLPKPPHEEENLTDILGTETNHAKQCFDNEINELKLHKKSCLKASSDKMVKYNRTTCVHITNKIGDIAKTKSGSKSRLKCHCNKICDNAKGALNTTSNSATRISSKRKVNLRFSSGIDTDNIKQSLENETNEIKWQRESSLKVAHDNKVKCDGTTCKQPHKGVSNFAKNTPGSEKRVKCHCNDIRNKPKGAMDTTTSSAARITNKHEVNLKFIPGTETNNAIESFDNDTKITPGSEKRVKCHCK